MQTNRNDRTSSSDLEAIKERFRTVTAKTPNKFCLCGCWEKFVRAQAAWRKHFETLENDKFQLAGIAKQQITRVLELEERIEKLKEKLTN